MKITNVTVTTVNIPLELPFLWTAGLYPGTSKAVIEVETDEASPGWAKHLRRTIRIATIRLKNPTISDDYL